jgi:hypothetical protein
MDTAFGWFDLASHLILSCRLIDSFLLAIGFLLLFRQSLNALVKNVHVTLDVNGEKSLLPVARVAGTRGRGISPYVSRSRPSPASRARIIAWARSATCNLLKILET